VSCKHDATRDFLSKSRLRHYKMQASFKSPPLQRRQETRLYCSSATLIYGRRPAHKMRYLLAIAGALDLNFLADKDSRVAWWYSLDINAKLAADAVQAVSRLHCVLFARRTMLCSFPGGKCDGCQRGVGVGQGGRNCITA
jgi:hypothetical protein